MELRFGLDEERREFDGVGYVELKHISAGCVW